MRRMRDLTFGHYVAAAVPVLAAAYGIQHWIRHSPGSAAPGVQTAAVIKPSQFKSQASGGRKIASVKGEKEIPEDHESDLGESEEGEGVPVLSAGHHESAPRVHASDASGHGEEKNHEHAAVHGKVATSFEGAVNDAVASGAECAPIEYRGEGPVATKVTKGEWTTVMDQFHDSKRDLLHWLEGHKKELSSSAVQAMERQVKNLKIQRPPASDEPDLAWRGIGIYAQNPEGEPIIKLGGGFVRLADKHPARARFEMARLVAQSWAPCELQRVSALDMTWSPLLKCLGVAETQGCGQGTYSEGAWAVSTTLAASVGAPGCQIPAFKTPEFAKCLRNVPLSRVTAQNEAIPEAAEGASRGIASVHESAHSAVHEAAHEEKSASEKSHEEGAHQ